jgi:hypothetical protein
MPRFISDDESRVRSYLLKLASEEELDQIEDAFLSTSEHSALISDAENRLISDYVQGRLSAEEEEAFQRNYAVTAERREQLAIARSLMTMVPQQAGARSATSAISHNIWRWLVDWMAVPGPVAGFAAAAIAVVLLFGNVAFYFRWREQARQTEIASQQVRTLQASRENPHTPTVARVFGVPVLKIEETTLSAGAVQKLRFRLPSTFPDTLAIPIEIPAATEGADVDVAISSAGQSVWSENGIQLHGTDKLQRAELLIPFSAIRPHLDKQMKLEIIERGHAVLGSFQLVFETER